MARKRELKAYNVIYNDGTYQTFEFTKNEFMRLAGHLLQKAEAFQCVEADMVLILKDVRTVVEHKELPKKEETPESQLTTGLPGGDLEINAYLRELEKLSEDAEYERRMLY